MDENKPLYGIIGYPVEHSLSPLMHNTAFKELGVDAVYRLFPVEEGGLDRFFEELRDKESRIFGLNVTVPYKEKVIKYLDTLTPFAQKVGAVNTIVITGDRRLIGYNTDAPGFMAHLHELQFDTTNKRIALLGSGGSARAILATLCMIPERPQSIRIYNRTVSRTDELLTDLGERIDLSMVEPVMSVDDLNIELSDLLVNTTPLGLNKNDPCLVDEDLLHGNMLVYDLIYNPPETPLLKMARRRGARASNGLGMLYYQGVLAFQHWANIQLDDDVKSKMRKSLEEGVRQ
jgi:shikimate dehydrogenase